MHEWALAEAVISTVDKARGEHIDEEGVKPAVTQVNVSIGELQSIEMDVFKMGLANLLDQHPYGLDVFLFATEKAAFSCNRCKEHWLLEEQAHLDKEEKEAIHFLPESAHVYMRCPSCGSPDFCLKKGRGVSIASIELET